MAFSDDNLEHELAVAKKPLALVCFVTNVIALVVVSVLFLSDAAFFSLLGCSCGGCFICFENLITELASIPFCVVGVIGTAHLNTPMTAIAGAWYIATATILTRAISKIDFFGSEDLSWVALLLFSVVAASLNFSLLLALRNGTITTQNALYNCCCKDCCSDCCSFREEDARDNKCLCLPYNDKWIIASLALSALATVLSAWVDWRMLLTSIGCMALLQMLWCNRYSIKLLMYSVVGIAMLCSLAHVGFGIYIIWFFQNHEGSCYGWSPYYAYDDDSSLDEPDWMDCVERWSRVVIAFVCGSLWAGVAASLGMFVYDGQYTMWEVKYTNIAANNNSSSNNRSSGEVDGGEIALDSAN